MTKNWELIKSLTPEELDIYHIIQGIWIIAKEFRYKLTPAQVEHASELYKSMMSMNLSWLVDKVTELDEGVEQDAYIKGLSSAVKQAQDLLAFKEVKQ